MNRRWITALPVLLIQPFLHGQSPGSSIEVLHVRPNLYMLASDSGNVTIQIGRRPGVDGVLLVDTGTAQMTATLLAEIRKISDQPIRYIISTSADEDHNGGTEAILKPTLRPGLSLQPEKAEIGIFAHDNVMTRMSAANSKIPQTSWPTLTFDKTKDFAFNGESVQILAEPNAHTDGDSIVFFRGSNVISTGDIFRTTGYPVIDIARGGSIQGELNAINHILELTVPENMQEGGTMVIPGHGRLCDEADVADYRDMITIIRDRVADMLKKGKSLAEVKGARLSRDYDRRFSTLDWTGDMFVEAIYKSLSQGSGSAAGRIGQ
jgi:cyclase